MAQFISIPVTNKGNALISTNGLCTTFISSTSIVLAAGGRIFSLAFGGTATPAALEAINSAALALNGPVVASVSFPEGQTCVAIVIS